MSNGTQFLCGMPPGDGPWRLKSFRGRIYAASASDGVFELGMTIDPDGSMKAQWVQMKLSEEGRLEAHVWDAFQPEEKKMSHMEEVERRSAALYKAPRVSLNDIKNAIACEYRLTAAEAVTGMTPVAPVVDPLKVLSICILVMKNGFTIIGKSAPASPENFDAEYGKQLAYEDAIKQVWPLMGFALRERLHDRQAEADAQKVPGEVA